FRTGAGAQYSRSGSSGRCGADLSGSVALSNGGGPALRVSPRHGAARAETPAGHCATRPGGRSAPGRCVPLLDPPDPFQRARHFSALPRTRHVGTGMGIRTGGELLASLRDGRQLFIDGERVGDVTTDPRFAAAARSLAELYDMQHDAALTDRMTFPSPTSGGRVGLSFIEPRSVEDLIRRRDMVKIWMDATCGMFGRSPDFMNIFFTGFASAADEFGKADKRFAENVRAYHTHIREDDICLTHTLVNPQVDRSRPVEKQDKDLAAKIVKETDAGIVIRGARMVSTLCGYAHDLLVLPSTYLANSKEAEPYAFGFSVAVNAPGLRFICRPSVIHQNAASVMDFPLSARLDETDAMVIFDDVPVPWE